MDTNKFFDLYQAELNNDHHVFAGIIKDVVSMTSPKIASLLNLACSLMDKNEIYLEVGCYRGGTLISALHGNNCEAVAIDNYSQFTENASSLTLERHLLKYNLTERVHFHEMDFVDYFEDAIIPPVGVYFYDGAHEFEPEYTGLVLGEPFLASHSLIFVDDINMGGVQSAVQAFKDRYYKSIRRTLTFTSPANGDSEWWNGLEILEYVHEH